MHRVSYLNINVWFPFTKKQSVLAVIQYYCIVEGSPLHTHKHTQIPRALWFIIYPQASTFSVVYYLSLYMHVCLHTLTVDHWWLSAPVLSQKHSEYYFALSNVQIVKTNPISQKIQCVQQTTLSGHSLGLLTVGLGTLSGKKTSPSPGSSYLDTHTLLSFFTNSHKKARVWVLV